MPDAPSTSDAREPLPPPPLPPNEVMASLTVKIGDVTRTSRKQLAVVAFPFLLSEGFDVFRAKANSCTARELQSFGGERHVREDPAVYIRPGAHSKQAELVELTDKNFEARVARSYRNFLKRKPGADALGANAGFECEVVTYVRKDVAARRHRVSASAAAGGHAAPTTSHAGYGYATTSPHAGLAHSGERLAMGYTDGYDDAHKSYGEQLSGHKRERSEMPGAFMDLSHEGDGYKTVRMVLNGAVVPVRVNVRDLLACFTVGSQTPAIGELAAGSGHDEPLHGVGGSGTGVMGGSGASSAGTNDGMI